MRKFLKTLFIVGGTSVAISLLLMALGLLRMRSFSPLVVAPGKTTLVVGNSMGRNSIDDSIIPSWHNACTNNEYFISTLPMLRMALDANPHIDTVVVTAGLPSFVHSTDRTYLNHSIQALREKSDRLAISNASEWHDALRGRRFIPYLLTSGIATLTSTPDPGAYEPLDGSYLHQPGFGGIHFLDSILAARGTREYTLHDFQESTLQTRYFEKIIDLCRSRGVVCIIYNPPLFHYDRWFSIEGYEEYLSTLGDPLPVADYTFFPFPDSTYYNDPKHLNRRGATVLSRRLRDGAVTKQ